MNMNFSCRYVRTEHDIDEESGSHKHVRWLAIDSFASSMRYVFECIKMFYVSKCAPAVLWIVISHHAFLSYIYRFGRCGNMTKRKRNAYTLKMQPTLSISFAVLFFSLSFYVIRRAYMCKGEYKEGKNRTKETKARKKLSDGDVNEIKNEKNRSTQYHYSLVDGTSCIYTCESLVLPSNFTEQFVQEKLLIFEFQTGD